MSKHRDGWNSSLWVLPSLAIPLVIAAFAWTSHVSSEGKEIAPNVTFAGVDVSRMDIDSVMETVTDRQASVEETPVIIDIGERRLVLTAEEIGFDYRYEETVDHIISARHADGPWKEFVSWVTTPLSPVAVGDVYRLDEEAARSRLAEDDFVLEAPVEPVLTNDDASYLYALPGVNGLGVDIDEVVNELEKADITDGTIEIVAGTAPIAPTISGEDARAMALAVNTTTNQEFIAVLDGSTATFTPGQLRSYLTSSVEDGVMSVSVDLEGFQSEVESMFPDPIGEFRPPVLEVVDGEVVVNEPGLAAPVCCSPESVAQMADEIVNDPHAFYRLDTRPADDPRLLAWADGSATQQLVSQFTTHHRCCENRVTNIHTIADAVNGFYLLPGQTFSLNGYVGPRTKEKGYLVDGAIRGGHHVNEIGGGVSQFTTTLFNAAFYGGLDLDEYQGHSVYFSRYPFGREATLSIPHPDLVFTNVTDYPILIWSTYDDTSITVSMYSTPNVRVEETGPRVSRRGLCRHTEIDRQRTFSDGRVVVDTIVGNYRPDYGLDCSGNVIPFAGS